MRTALLALALGLTAATASTQEAAPPPLSVLWIIGEDLGPALSCYGEPAVRTPNLDALARDGVRFARAFSTAPVCSASRSAFMTGCYQTSIGAHNHRSHRGDGHRLPEGVTLLTDRLRQLGVFTANIRQLGDSKEEKWASGGGKTDWNFQVDGPAFDGRRFDQLAANRPFYAQINYPETHRGGAWDRAHLHIPEPADPAKVRVPECYPDVPGVREDQAQYLNAVMALDQKVGIVLRRLEASGLADETVVVFMADHGRATPRGKQWCYDSGLHVPLIIRWPEGREPQGFRRGSVDQRVVTLLDVTATTLDIAGGRRPMTMHGRVLFGPHAEPARRFAFAARDRCDETVFRIRTVRGERFRYVRNFMPERPFFQLNRYKEWSYPTIALMREMHEAGELKGPPAALFAPTRPAEELYDTLEDPDEVRNLAGDPDHAAVLERMRAALDTWIVESGDQGHIPEDPAEIEKWLRKMQQTYDARLEKRRGK